MNASLRFRSTRGNVADIDLELFGFAMRHYGEEVFTKFVEAEMSLFAVPHLNDVAWDVSRAEIIWS